MSAADVDPTAKYLGDLIAAEHRITRQNMEQLIAEEHRITRGQMEQSERGLVLRLEQSERALVLRLEQSERARQEQMDRHHQETLLVLQKFGDVVGPALVGIQEILRRIAEPGGNWHEQGAS